MCSVKSQFYMLTAVKTYGYIGAVYNVYMAYLLTVKHHMYLVNLIHNVNVVFNVYCSLK